MNDAPIEIETARLRLRQWREEDRAAFAALSADPRVMAYFPATLSRDESDRLAERIQGLIEARGWGLWAVEMPGERRFIGCVGLHVPAPELPVSPCVEIGWRLAFDYWGRGLALEAARAALAVGFERLGLGEIIAFTATDNRRSRALMERLGMDFRGERFEHPALPKDSPLAVQVVYRLSRPSWQRQFPR